MQTLILVGVFNIGWIDATFTEPGTPLAPLFSWTISPYFMGYLVFIHPWSLGTTKQPNCKVFELNKVNTKSFRFTWIGKSSGLLSSLMFFYWTCTFAKVHYNWYPRLSVFGIKRVVDWLHEHGFSLYLWIVTISKDEPIFVFVMTVVIVGHTISVHY